MQSTGLWIKGVGEWYWSRNVWCRNCIYSSSLAKRIYLVEVVIVINVRSDQRVWFGVNDSARVMSCWLFFFGNSQSTPSIEHHWEIQGNLLWASQPFQCVKQKSLTCVGEKCCSCCLLFWFMCSFYDFLSCCQHCLSPRVFVFKINIYFS